jgi:hypothetical protein
LVLASALGFEVQAGGDWMNELEVLVEAFSARLHSPICNPYLVDVYLQQLVLLFDD